MAWWLILHENIYYQQSKGLLDNSIYKGWANDLEEFVKGQKLWLQWDSVKNNYQPEFSNHVSQLIEKNKPRVKENKKS